MKKSKEWQIGDILVKRDGIPFKHITWEIINIYNKDGVNFIKTKVIYPKCVPLLNKQHLNKETVLRPLCKILPNTPALKVLYGKNDET